ncbi:MAG: phosphate ABC transporter substrate-binding protein PstS [Chloroflexi bacterium]|nr:phosphate ABC transporter substrate-binding protein PstS [Chloroflexota bacterium]
MRTKSLISTLVAIVMLASLLVGCASTSQPVTSSGSQPATNTPAAPAPTKPAAAPAATTAPTVAAPAAAKPTASSSGLSLTGAGATFPYPLYSKWFDVYEKQTGVKINYQSIGSGGGIQQISERTVDFGASDAPMTDDQLKAAKSELLHIPTVIGAVVVIYNLPGIDKGLKLTPEALSGIYLGEITKWNDPKITADNADLNLPDTSIVVVERSDGSGTSNIFTDYLSSVSATWKDKVGKGTSVKWPVGLGAKGNEGVAGQVKQTQGGIGYVELAYAVQNKLGYAMIKNKAGKFVEATLDSTTAAAAGAVASMPDDLRVSIVNAGGDASYPIAGFTYLLVYKDQTDQVKGKGIADFIWWAIHDGEGYAKDLLYAPLPNEVVTKAEAKVKSLNYQGKTLVMGQ